MKKKALILAGLCAFGLCIGETEALNSKTAFMYYEADNIPDGYEKILLHGVLDTNAGPDDIEAGANENSVYLHFNRSFGNVDIKIYNATGNLIYNGMVDTSMQQTVIIPISSVAIGTYTVVLDNANGYAEGDFERN